MHENKGPEKQRPDEAEGGDTRHQAEPRLTWLVFRPDHAVNSTLVERISEHVCRVTLDDRVMMSFFHRLYQNLNPLFDSSQHLCTPWSPRISSATNLSIPFPQNPSRRSQTTNSQNVNSNGCPRGPTRSLGRTSELASLHGIPHVRLFIHSERWRTNLCAIEFDTKHRGGQGDHLPTKGTLVRIDTCRY